VFQKGGGAFSLAMGEKGFCGANEHPGDFLGKKTSGYTRMAQTDSIPREGKSNAIQKRDGCRGHGKLKDGG